MSRALTVRTVIWSRILIALMLAAPALTCVGVGRVEAHRAYLPLLLRKTVCQPLEAQNYLTLSADPPHPGMAAEVHPDLNPLVVRGYVGAQASAILVTYGGTPDPYAPQLHDLFVNRRLPAFSSVYRARSWDWDRMRPGPVITTPTVTLLGLQTFAGEVLYVPDSGYTIGSDAEVLVLYASADRLTLKYTRDDNVVRGYTLYLGGICTDPALVARYVQCASTGRTSLPALLPRQAFGRAAGEQVLLAIADTGTLMDPRSRRDWWQGH